MDAKILSSATSESSGQDVAFEVKWTGLDDKSNPQSHLWAPLWRKWLIVLVVSSSSMCVTCASAAYTSTYHQIEVEFDINTLQATCGLSLFVLGLGLGPMLLAPISEVWGRRPVYVIALGMFLIWLVPCAMAHNLTTMLIARFLDGLAGSAFLSVSGGTVADMFTVSQLGGPMMVFTAAPFMGPVLGPCIGGFVNSFTSWRWTFFVLLIWTAINLVLVVLCVPETYHPKLLTMKAQTLRKTTGDERWWAPLEVGKESLYYKTRRRCTRPLQLLFFECFCLYMCLESALLLGVLYLFFGVFDIVFQTTYDFNLWQSGLSFLGLFVGMLFGIFCEPLWANCYRSLAKRNHGSPEPRFRLVPTVIGSVLVPVGIFGFGWTSYPSIHWIVPIALSSLIGMGILVCFSGIFTSLVEYYPQDAASALAANSFTRALFAAAFPLFGDQLYRGLGFQWASSLLAFVATAMIPFPFLFFVYGKRQPCPQTTSVDVSLPEQPDLGIDVDKDAVTDTTINVCEATWT